MVWILALCTVVSTTIGGLVALRARDRMHLVLGASAGVLLGLVAFDLLPEIFRLAPVPEGGVPLTMVAFVIGFLVLHVVERASGVHEPADSEYGEHHHHLAGTIGAAGLVVHSFLDGLAIGLAFQVVDDILDVTADSATLGKTAGKDASQDKPTYVSVLGLTRSIAYAQDLLAQALQALQQSGLRDTRALQGLANMVVNRVS